MKNQNKSKRFRDYGFNPGFLPPGPLNSITDVTGVRVGQITKIEGDNIRTGLTLIDPGIPDLYRNKLPAAIEVGNGYGKLTGVTQVRELGTLEAPIALTNTHAVGPVMRGVVELVLRREKIDPVETVNAVVGETNDGYLNDLSAESVGKGDVFRAAEELSDKVAEGCVGAGTGTRAFSWKGGIGTSSRKVAAGGRQFILGALLQVNYGGALTILGVPVGRLMGSTDFDSILPSGDGSCMIVLATDAPLSARQLGRIARRTFLGLARTGSVLAHGSGDYAIAFTTSRTALEGAGGSGSLPDAELTPFFLAAAEAAEESAYNAMCAAVDTTGRAGNSLQALPMDKVGELLRERIE